VNTIYTPEALERSVAKGKYKTCLLRDLSKTDTDDAFVFVFPSPDLINADNGDGNFLEVWDYARDLSSVTTSRGDIVTNPETVIYYTWED
jgi:hypothetical protein